MIKTGLNGYVYNFYVDYETIDISDIIKIYKYLMEKQDIKQCLDFKKCLLSALASRSLGESLTSISQGRIKCISLNNKLFLTRPTSSV